jgi:L-asparaginase II
MRTHHWWVAGPGRTATRLCAAVPGPTAKDGAEGVFVAALPDGRAVVLKVLDGSVRPVAAVVVAALRALGVDTPALDAAAVDAAPATGSRVEPVVASPPPDDGAG